MCAFEFAANYKLEKDNTWAKRDKEAVVKVWPRFYKVPDRHLEKEKYLEFCQAEVLLYFPFRSIDHLLQHHNESWLQAFDELQRTGYVVRHVQRVVINEDHEMDDNDLSEDPTFVDAPLPAMEHEWMQVSRLGPNMSPEDALNAKLGERDFDLLHPWESKFKGLSFSEISDRFQQSIFSSANYSSPFQRVDPNCLGIQQRKIFDCTHKGIYVSPRQMLLTVLGSAGTGKSYLINAVRSLLTERSGAGSVAVVAPTGVAAFNIKGRTLASAFKIWKGTRNKTLQGSGLKTLQQSFENLKLLIVDELSFIGGEDLESLDRRLRQLLPGNSSLPFGGVSVMLLGDLFQLPPVKAAPPYSISPNSNPEAVGLHS